MKPVKIISFNALWHISILCFFMVAVSLQLKAQCSSSLQSTSYNIYLNGTGNNGWGFSIPQFDPSLGTLVAVDIRAVVLVNVNFQLTNGGTTTDSYNVLAGRFDSIASPALTSPITNTVSQNMGPYTLQAGQDTVGAGTNVSPQFFLLQNGYTINDSITSAVAPFLGVGYVPFSYNLDTYTSITAGSNGYIGANYNDTMRIRLTYYFCTQSILAEDITTFLVSKKNGNLADITWDTQNETPGRTYDIEESADKKTFHPVANIQSVVNDEGSGNYDYLYPIPPGTTGKLYFRLKETNADGYMKYSDVRTIDVENSNQIYLYPNPANSYINIIINQPSANGRIADIYSADGKLVQRSYLDNSSIAHIDFAHSLAKGAYFIRLIARNSNNSEVLSFIVQ